MEAKHSFSQPITEAIEQNNASALREAVVASNDPAVTLVGMRLTLRDFWLEAKGEFASSVSSGVTRDPLQLCENYVAFGEAIRAEFTPFLKDKRAIKAGSLLVRSNVYVDRASHELSRRCDDSALRLMSQLACTRLVADSLEALSGSKKGVSSLHNAMYDAADALEQYKFIPDWKAKNAGFTEFVNDYIDLHITTAV